MQTKGGGFHPTQLFLFMLEHRRLTKWKIVFPKKKHRSTKVHIVYKCLPLRRFSLELRGSDLAYFFFWYGQDLFCNRVASYHRVTKPWHGPERSTESSSSLSPPFLLPACASGVSEHGPALPRLLRGPFPSIRVLRWG